MPRLTLTLFGAPQLALDGALLRTDRRKAIALLAYLSVTGRAHTRDALATLLWPEFDAGQAYAYLRRTLWELNQMLGKDWLEADRELVRLRLEGDLWCDVSEFERLAGEGLGGGASPGADALPSLEQAQRLAQADFLEGFSLRDSPGFDHWQFSQAEHLRSRLGAVLEALAGIHARRGDYPAALEHAQRWLGLDTLNEAAHRLLMRLYAESGQRSAALQQFQECARVLKDQLNTAPQPETRRLHEQIRGGLIQPAGPLPAPGPAPHPQMVNLPAEVTPFVGRSQEIEQLCARLAEPGCRLLTLVGPGGIGKTRLAVQVARSLAAHFPHGVIFVPLAPVNQPERVLHAVAEALRFSFSTSDTMGVTATELRLQLLDYLREKSLLLTLDNFEHLVSAGSLLSEILAIAPGVKALATSRVRLHLREEWAYELGGMSYPQNGDQAALETFSAVRLFLQSAQRVQAGFMLTAADAPDVGRICRLVQGAPLGIELAAGWVRLLSCREIADEIERNLDFLADAPAGAPERHQSLRAVFDHSWRLLSPPEQAAFRRLSVFRGGFTRQAAQAVAGADLRLLSALVDQSLVRRDPSGRYDLHELLKQYAYEKLSEAGEQAEILAAHSRYILTWLTGFADDLKGRRAQQATAEIDRDGENLRLAWQTAVTGEDWPLIRLAIFPLVTLVYINERVPAGFAAFKLLADQLSRLEGQSAYAGLKDIHAVALTAQASLAFRLVALNELPPPAALQPYEQAMQILKSLPADFYRATSLVMAGFRAQTDAAAIRQDYEESMRVFQSAGDRWSQAIATLTFADTMSDVRLELSEAGPTYEQALALFEDLGSLWGIALSANGLSSIVYQQGDYERARSLASYSLQISASLNQPWNVIGARLRLGQVATALGDYDEAIRHYQQNLQEIQELGSEWFCGVLLDALGYTEVLRGDLKAAEGHFQASLEIGRKLNASHSIGMALGNLGDVAYRRGDLAGSLGLYRQALEQIEAAQGLWGITVMTKKIGYIHLDQGELEAAEAQFQRSLAISLQIERDPQVLELFTGYARLALLRQDAEQAVALLHLAASHPKTAQDIRQQAQTRLAELAAELPAGVILRGREQGAALANLALAEVARRYLPA